MRTHSGVRFNLTFIGVNILAFIRSSTLCLLTFLRCFVTSADILNRLRNFRDFRLQVLISNSYLFNDGSFLPAKKQNVHTGDYTWVDL